MCSIGWLLDKLISALTELQLLRLTVVCKAGISTMTIEGIARIQVSHAKKSSSGNFHTIEVKFPVAGVKTLLSKFIRKKTDQYEDELTELFGR